MTAIHKRDLNGKPQLRIIIDLRDWWIIPETTFEDSWMRTKEIKWLCFTIVINNKKNKPNE